MKDLLPNYSSIADEIRYFHNLILKESSLNPQVKKLYKGCQVLFSPLKQRPKILLIGFNPGGGYYNWHGKIVEEFEPMEALEYYLNSHPLAEQTKSLFRQAGREEDLKHLTVKTNFYYWATDNVADFNELLKLLPDELSKKIFHQARVWTKQLINSLQPEMIVTEGFKAYDEISVLFPEKLEEKNNEFYKSFPTPEGLRVLGYKRNQGSIFSKNNIIKKLATTTGRFKTDTYLKS